jgi:Domain of Unknown Function with PDB structure (DUF3857)/Transglutaminase-like superfamily
MKKQILLLTGILFLFASFIIAQKREQSPVKFGKVSVDDFKKVYSIDSSAYAVVIADIGYSSFVGNNSGWFSLEFERQVRIHILNKNAYDVANFEVPLYTSGSAEEELVNVKATTYNLENGKVVETKLDKGSVFKDRIDKNIAVKKFTLPNLKEGCIIEVEYKVKSDFLRNLQSWIFQGEHPVLWSEYSVGIPEFFSYITLTQGYRSFDINERKERNDIFTGSASRGAGAPERFSFNAVVTDYRWVMKNVNALKIEAFTSTLRNHISKIEFQLNAHMSPLAPRSIMGTWKELDDELSKSENFGAPIRNDHGYLGDEIPPKAKLIKEANLEKAKLIFEYVRENYTCTDHNAKFLSQNLRNLIKTKNGNVADINLLLVGILRTAGFQADPVLLGLRSRGITYSMYPLLDRFNFIIAQLILDGKKYYLDASDPVLGFGRLDPLCYNGHARVINGEPEAIEFNTDMLNEKKLSSVFIINENGKLSGAMQQVPGYAASSGLRSTVRVKGNESVKADIKKGFNAEVDILNFRIDSLNKKDDPVGIFYDFLIETGTEDIIYLNPMFGEGYKNNPFKSAERYYPVEMPYTMDETYILSMEVPAGYAIDEMPKPIVLKLNDEGEGLFEYRISESGGTISLCLHRKNMTCCVNSLIWWLQSKPNKLYLKRKNNS